MKQLAQLLAATALCLGATLFGMALAANYHGRASNVPDVPAAEFETLSVDLGTIRGGETVRGVFPVHNNGARRLVLTPVICSSCGQPGATEQAVVVPPGATEAIVVPLDTTGLHGPVRHTVRYTSSDSQNPVVNLTIRADVLQ